MAKKATIFEPIGQSKSFNEFVNRVLYGGNELNENKKILKAIADSKATPLIIGDIELDCYVLEDKTRVLSGTGLQKALGHKFC